MLESYLRLRVWKIARRSFPDFQLRPPGPSSCALIGHVGSEEVRILPTERRRNDSENPARSCLTGKSHELTGHRPSRGGEPIPSLNGSPVGQDKFLLPPRTNSVTSTLARHRLSAQRPRDHGRHRQSAYGCLEQLVLGTSSPRAVDSLFRNSPAASVRETRNTNAPGKAKKYPSEREIVDGFPTSDSTKGTTKTSRKKNFNGFYRGDGTYYLTSEAIWMLCHESG